MDDVRTEEEQIEAIKKWWDENGKSTVFAIVLGVGAVFGWQGWQKHQASQNAQASDVYQSLLQTVAEGSELTAAQLKSSQHISDQLKNDFGGSSYAQLAAMLMAKAYVERDELESAEQQLRWALDAGGDDNIQAVLRLRLATVQFARGENDAALTLLGQPVSEEFAGSYAELRGDVLRDKGDYAGAVAAYEEAKQNARTQNAQLLDFKLSNAKRKAGVSEVPAAAEDAAEESPAGEAAAVDANESAETGSEQATTPDADEN